jgi:hypothetical protein
MTDEQERAALEVADFIRAAVVYPGVASRTEIRKPLLSIASKALKGSEGTPRNELELAMVNLRAL